MLKHDKRYSIIIIISLLLPFGGFGQDVFFKDFFVELRQVGKNIENPIYPTLDSMFSSLNPQIHFVEVKNNDNKHEFKNTNSPHVYPVYQSENFIGGILINLFEDSVAFIYDISNKKFNLITFNPIPQSIFQVDIKTLYRILTFNTDWELELVTSFVSGEIDAADRVGMYKNELAVFGVRYNELNVNSVSIRTLLRELYTLSKIESNNTEWAIIGCKNTYVKKLCKTCQE